MRLVEHTQITIKDAIATSPLQTAVNGVNMAKYERCRITLLVTCTNSTVVGGIVTLKQGTSATCATALTFSEYWKNEDVLAADALTHVGAYGGPAISLATAGIQNKTAMYVFEVKASMLDSSTWGSENVYIRLDQTAITTATGTATVIYELYEARVARGAEGMPSGF